MTDLIVEQKALIEVQRQLASMVDTIHENPPNLHCLSLQVGVLSYFVNHFLRTHDIKLKDDE